VQLLALAGAMSIFPVRDRAQTAEPRALITQAIDEERLVALPGNTRLEANSKNDLGPVGNDLHLDMYLQLKRSPERDLAAKRFVESLTDKSSPNFHKWITAAEYGRRFGAAPEDIATVSRWLESHGFTVNGVPAHNMAIDFSGTAGQVRQALRTQIHALDVAGERHFANMSDPQIPAALLPAVTGVVSLHDFKPHPMLVARTQYTVGSQWVPVVPGDLATIYNLNPAFAGGYTGLGQTIVVVEDSDLYNGPADWGAFRDTFGLSKYAHGSLTVVHPAPGAGGTACVDPGVSGADVEAAIDVEWASAAAPDAAIVVASCEDTTNFGGFIALQNLLTNGGPLPSVVSISYGESETDSGAAENSFISTLYQTAAAAGVSVFVSSGDEAAAETDHRAELAIHGVSVSSFASTPYDVAVGGTDFGDTAAGTIGTFWNSANGVYYDSARSYVPEIPWNNSCASVVLANYLGYATAYGASSYCNSTYWDLTAVGGSGGPSGCATGTPPVTGVVGGTCAGYPKPSWQSVFGNPSDGVRDLPDVALFAASGLWGHYYVFCSSDLGGCSGPPSGWPGAGGTSFAAPIMAGIQALINQALATNNVGNPNPVYYQIAQSEYSAAAGRGGCNSTTGPASSCSFNDVTQGDMDVPCAGVFDCYFGGGGLGVLSTSNTSYEPAYAAAPGWDFATGLGSVNAFNLLNAFVDSIAPSSAPAPPVLASPANGAPDVLPGFSLTWNASARATSYDVYFGTASTPPLVANTTNIDYAPGALGYGTTYYWAVGARNALGANVSTVWSFTMSCVAALNPSSAAAPASGGTGTINVTATAGCPWTAVSNVPWIAITSGASGSGSGTVGYTVAADTTAQRSGTMTIAGQTFTVTQAIYPLISTLAGGAMPPTAAPGASLSIPVSYGVAADAAGNVYFPSPNLNAVFKADPSGVVTRIAGTGIAGHLGDGGSALSAQLNGPNGVAVDASSNVYIADTSNSRIRKVDTSGNISTVAGDGTYGYSGDSGAATSARIGSPYGLAVDPSGNLYVSDVGHNVVRMVAASGMISTVAGNGTYGYSGDGGAATSAELRYPYGVAVDTSGNLYIADYGNQRIRKVGASGTITTVAGNGSCCFSGDGGPATSAELYYPAGVAATAAGAFYIASGYGNRVRMVSTSGIIATVAGNGGSGFSGDGGAATSAQLANPEGVAVDSSGNLYVADQGNVRVRKVSSAGVISTLLGGMVGDGGLGVFGALNQPSGVARDNAGNTYVADTIDNRVRKVALDGTISTVAGTGAAGFSGDSGPAASARLNTPRGLAMDASGNLYIADSTNFRVRKVAASGNISTVAGSGIYGNSGAGGPATSARMGYPYGLAVDSSGNLYIADESNNLIWKVAASGTITTVAGNGTYGYSGDGGPATGAEMSAPTGVAVDSAGNLYAADRYNDRVRMVSASGTITTVAGNGNCCFSGDGGPATGAELSSPTGVALDSAGNLYIADSSRIRMVSPSGIITTAAGGGSSGYSGDGGPAVNASFRTPYAISVDASGGVAVADQGNNAVRQLTPAGTRAVLTIQSSHTSVFTRGQTGVTYTLTVSNGSGAGNTAGTVTVSEILPTGLTLASMAGSGWTCSAPTCTRSDALAGGSSYPPITTTVNVSAAAAAQLTNRASVSGGGASPAGAGDLTVVAASSRPPAPVLASPANGATGVSLASALMWDVSAGATSYDVCLGASAPPPVVATTSATTYSPGALTAGTTYYWQIVARNGSGSASSVTWSFTTQVGPPVLLSPSNAAIGVSLSPTLNWTASLGALSYDVYFGTQVSPPLATNTTATSYSPGTLSPGTLYFWQVVASNGATASASPVWSFATPGTPPPVTALQFVAVTPCRVADTRGAAGPFGGPTPTGGSTRSFAIPQGACGIPSTAQAYSLNVTAVPERPLGYLSLWPAGQAQPAVSTLNSWGGIVVANAAIVPAGTGGAVSVFVSDPTDVILDINGYFDSTGSAFYPATPCRVADTRNASAEFGGPSMSSGQTRGFPIPVGSCGIPSIASAYAMNVTVVPNGPLGYLSTWPTGQAQPYVSTLNSWTGKVVADAAIVPAGTDESISVFVTDPTDVILDINGYFAPPGNTGALNFYPLAPCRVADTRNPAGPFGGPEMQAGATRSFAIPASVCSVPSTAAAYSMNVTVVPDAALGYLTAWQTGAAQPYVSTLNSWDGSVVANAAIVPAGANGAISVFVSNSTDVILDINGYFAP
jgi:uncharacterized repeat protein (TIGR01451 family)